MAVALLMVDILNSSRKVQLDRAHPLVQLEAGRAHQQVVAASLPPEGVVELSTADMEYLESDIMTTPVGTILGSDWRAFTVVRASLDCSSVPDSSHHGVE